VRGRRRIIIDTELRSTFTTFYLWRHTTVDSAAMVVAVVPPGIVVVIGLLGCIAASTLSAHTHALQVGDG
jgi:hypothetical protein